MEPGLLALYSQGGAEFTVLGLSNGRGGRDGARVFRLDAGESGALNESLAECGGRPQTGRRILESD